MDADLPVDDEFQPGQTHPGIRQPGERERLVRRAYVHHDLHRNVGHLRQLGRLHGEIQDSVVDEPGVTLGAGNGDRPPVGQVPGRAAGADHCRDAELAGDDRRMAGPATAVGDDRRRPFHDRLPVRVGHVRDQHLARDELMHRIDRLKDTDRSGADPLPDRPTLYQHRALLVHPETLHAPNSLPGLHRLRPSLQDVQAVVDTILSPTRCPSAARSAPRSPPPAEPAPRPPRRSG